jgi:hypothetical protein
VHHDLVIAAAGLPALEIAVPDQGQVGKGALLHWALALDFPRLDDYRQVALLDDGAHLKLASEVTATLATDPKKLYDLAHFRELYHDTSPNCLPATVPRAESNPASTYGCRG